MGRKKAIVAMRKEKSALDLDKDWDCISTTSSGTTWTTCAEEFEKKDDAAEIFQNHLDQLFEQRYSTREKALAKILQFLRTDVHTEECAENSSTIVSRCLNGLKRGGPAEASLCAQVLGLHFISMPQPDEELLQEVQHDLQRAATGAGEVRVAAIETLAMGCFIAGGDDDITTEVMQRLRSQWERGDAKGRAAAIKSWTLLFTSLSALPQGSVVEDLLAQLARLLHDTREVEVRNAVGEAVGTLVHCCGLGELCTREANGQGETGDSDLEADGEEEEGLEDHDVEAEGVQGNRHTCEEGRRGASSGVEEGEEGVQQGLGGVVGRMRELAAVGKKRTDALRHGRRAKAEMRSAFRSVLAVVEHSQVTPTKIKLQHGDTLVVDTMRGNVSLNAFRKMLAGGFQVHLQHNSLLHEVFDFQPSQSRPERMSAQEKRFFRSPNSAAAKSRTADRRGGRQAKASSMML
ncbi:interferon-related developmental regulator-domain-containing protein [Dunaliella salina]|uniref:Interferon-related developmental regulator-domain-containing protein n=1 Tax=Dunaliella salina TaxID=3046 RepID=A0ABQ7G4C3_DUNSA|nr:interferon-related developmental regulator-domain-containing protein [Dunaliella salina]|eukprot:KAF5829468.1 interferon-related developmental regulator-domain-containing protein [Dunaliella salina]